MKTHADIIKGVGGPSALLSKVALPISIHTARSWVARDSIPAEYWSRLAGRGLATLEELAAAAAARSAANDTAANSEAA